MANPALRYSDLIGQSDAVAKLKSFTDFFRSAGTSPGHILLIGEEGMGQSTICRAIASELDARFQEVDAGSLLIAGDLTALLTNLHRGDVLHLSRLSSLRKIHYDRISESLRDMKLEITIGARKHVMDIHPYTLIGTCRTKSECPVPLFGHFSLIVNLQPYSRPELQLIVQKMGEQSGMSVDFDAAEIVARNFNGRRLRDLESTLLRISRATGTNTLTRADVVRAFEAFGIGVGLANEAKDSPAIEELSGEDFERLITGLLIRMGFQAEMTRTTGDGGIDIVALLEKPIVGGRYLFQCKRFAPDNLVGSPTVRDFYGAVTADRAVKGIFITTSDYTVQAREFADKVGLELINMVQLRALLRENGLTDTDQ